MKKKLLSLALTLALGLGSVVPASAAENDFLISDDGVLLSYDGTASKVVIPNSVKRISSGLFNDCDFLKEVTIPPSVTTIGTMSFYNCKNLTTVNIPSNLTDIGTY
ncbi:leucine-rich repeat domain-containing protein [Oscillibacter sp. CU971]|uniref:leucine-rich repeat domain-containing protein n=1 Tax=Oscillibacter sp. CU971 TaxID=2780102 RepID=UPI00195A9270|nr:leucine-rich repeat domain-containing protein [Oscillibacter sp. CU971]